uniref:ecto-ADP-ribosyltransferase 4-like n=1 Tax=Monopterus albus TaxID=43700 RepID=UPI0009B3CF15
IHFSFTKPDANHVFPLDMAEKSVDDMYCGCNKEMMELVQHKYLKKEFSGLFANAWKVAKRCAKRKRRTNPDLTELHLTAICLYTANEVYQKFNKAVRTERDEYTSSFKFHSLHYLLASAIQILNNNYNCLTTYRRTNVRFTGNVNQIIRFGSFASSSFKKNLKNFGHESCFQIETCFGGYLKHYSTFGAKEKEVLIPPYEVFKITEIIRGKKKIRGLSDCKVVYILKHEGAKSQLNCKVAHN